MNDKISRKISVYMLAFAGVIILFHSEFRYYYPVINDLTVMANAFFFCVSAFFFYRPSEKTVGTKLKRRVTSLLLPYFLWNLIYLIVKMFQEKIPAGEYIDVFTTNPICTPSWYLLSLFILFLPAPIIAKILSHKWGAVVVVLSGVLVSLFGFVLYPEKLYVIPYFGGYFIRVCEYVLPYAIGAALGAHFEKFVKVGLWNCIVGILLACGGFAGLMLNLPAGFKWLICVLLPLALWEAVPEPIFGFEKIIGFFTAPTFFLIMSHCLLLRFAGLFTSRITAFHEKYVALIRVVMACVLSYVLFYLMKKFLPKVLHYLTGKR